MSKPYARIDFGGETVKATKDNSVLYNHRGVNEVYDHLWVRKDSESGGYIWKEQPPNNPVYTTLAAKAVEAGVEVHLNIKTPAPTDIEAFGRTALKDLATVPDWLPEI